MGAPAGLERQPEPPPPPPPVATPLHRVGRSVTLRTDSGPSPDAQFEIVDLNDPIVSHSHTDFSENPAFPQDLQHRERERSAVAQAVIERTNRLDPERLGENPMASDGAPVVGPDNVTEVGNGRMMSLRRAADAGDERWVAYHRWLRDNAGRFGLGPEAFSDVENPILVRRRTEDLHPDDRVEFVRAANEPTVEALGASEQARVDAQRVTPEHLSVMDVPDSGDLLAPGNRRFMDRFVSEVVPPSQRSAMFDREGVLSQEAARRARGAVFARAYGEGTGLLERLTESTTDDAKNVTAALVRAAPRFSRLRADIDAGRAHPNLDLAPELARAAGTLVDLRNRGVTVEQELTQSTLFARDPVEVRLLELIAQNRRSARRIGDVLTEYANLADEEPPPQQGAFFTTAPPDRGALLDRAAARVNGGGLFESPAVQAQKAQIENGKQQATANESSRLLDAQIEAAEAAGDFARSQRLIAERDLMQRGTPLIGGGAPLLSEEIYEKARALGLKEDPRILVESLKDRPGLFRFLESQDMYFRNAPEYMDPWYVLQKAGWERHLLAHQWLDRGFYPAWRSVPKAEVPKLIDAMWEDSMSPGPRMTPEAVAAKGLTPASHRAYTVVRDNLDAMLPTFVNPIREEMGLPPVTPIDKYLPHMWFGVYDLYVNDIRHIDATAGSSFPTSYAAYRVAQQLAKADPTAHIEIRPRYQDFRREMTGLDDLKALTPILQAFERADVIDSTTGRNIFLETLDPVGWGRHLVHRQGAPGYERARLPEVLERYFTGAAQWVPLRKARPTIDALMARIDARKRPFQHAAMEKLVNSVYGEQDAISKTLDAIVTSPKNPLSRVINPRAPTMRGVRGLKNLTYDLKLGLLNWSYPAVHLSHAITHLSGVVGPEYAAKGARAYLFPTAHQAGWLQLFEDMGQLQPQFFDVDNWDRGWQSLANSQNFKESAASVLRIAKHFTRFFGFNAERALRGTSLMGIVERLEEVGTKPDRIISMATDFARDHFEEANANIIFNTALRLNDRINLSADPAVRPRISTGPAGQLFYQFKNFLVGGVQLWKRNLDWARRPEGELSPLLWQTGALGAIAGLTGFPGWRAAERFYQWLHPDGRSPTELVIDAVQKTAQAAGTTSETGQAVAEATLHGLPALLGIDASRRLGMDPSERIESSGDVLQQIPGAALTTLTDAVGELWSQDYDHFVQRTMSGPARLWTLVKIARDGIERDPKGRPRVTVDNRDLLARVLGFQPLAVTEFGEVQRFSRERAAIFHRQKAGFVQRMLSALQASDTTDMMAAMEEAQQAGIPITQDDLKRAEAARATPGIERLYKQTPKPLRQEFMERFGEQRQRERARALLGR